MSELPSGIVSLLLTDIQGSTALWERHPHAMRQALARHDEIVAERIGEQGGILLKHRGEGDSVFVVFARATDAVAAACALQRALIAEPWPVETPLRVRIAVHTGEAELRDGDYYGSAVNRCARLRAIAHGGQILLSQTTYDLVRDSLPDDAGALDLGDQRLRDMERTERAYQLLHPSLPSDFPPLNSLDALPNNLPRQLTSFIGREKEMEEVRARLAKTPLLTLTGAGGSGKTRLALQVAAEVLDEYPDGVWLTELASLLDSALVPRAVAQAVRMQEDPNRGLQDALIEHLKPKTLLLVLDNCEHLLDACARLADTLLRACPGLRILATSRQSLGIGGESTYPVPTLSLPDPKNLPPLKRVVQYEAVRLFGERAAAALPSFEITKQTAPAVAQICRRLEGIPLAIELAAVRVRALSVSQIAERLDKRFDLLTGGSSVGLDRHKTLQATMDWSYDLLTQAEQTLFRRLSVFVGGWTLEAAERVCADEDDGPQALSEASVVIRTEEVLDTLSRLVDKSLVLTEPGTAGRARFNLLEPIRQYSLRRLEELGTVDRLRERHRDYFLELSEEAEPHLQQPDQKEWLDRLEEDHDNLRAALAWSVESDVCIRLACALYRFWYLHSHFVEGRAWLQGALSRYSRPSDELQARALNAAGVLAYAQTDYGAARRLHQQSVDVRRQTGDLLGIAASLNNLGLVCSREGEYEQAEVWYKESLETHRRLDYKQGTAAVLANLAGIAFLKKDYMTAEEKYKESLSIYRTLGDTWGEATMLHNLGMVAFERKDYDAATLLLQEGLSVAANLKDKSSIAISLNSLGMTSAALGDYHRAANLFGAASHILQSIDAPLPLSGRNESDEWIAIARDSLGEEAFMAGWSAGSRMQLEEVIEYALDLAHENSSIDTQ